MPGVSRFFPHLQDMRLTDFKVRGERRMAPLPRCCCRDADAREVWNTIGVSTNTQARSVHDAVDYAMMRERHNGAGTRP